MWLKIAMTEKRIIDMKENIVIIVMNPSKE